MNNNFEKTSNINKEAAQIKRILRKTANESIPLSHKPRVRNNPIWFNSEISKLIRLRREAWKTYKRCRILYNMLEYRKFCAKVLDCTTDYNLPKIIRCLREHNIQDI